MADELDENGIPKDDEQEPGAPRVAAPFASSSMPAVAVRALPAPGVSPQSAARTGQAENELSRLSDTGSGIAQIHNHPVARGILRGLDTVGSIVAPRITAAIPGTELHHQRLIGQEQGLLGKNLGTETQEAGLAKTGADTEEAKARADLAQAQAEVARNPKTGLTPEEITIHDLMTGDNGKPRVNPKTGQPYNYLDAYTAVNEAKEGAKPQKPEKPDTPEQQFIDDYQKKNPKATIADAVKAYTLATTRPEKAGAADARADRSYTYNNNKLDALGKPIEDAEARMGRLRESLAQNTPSADAEIAPELLTIMAGGAGSGLRMNEAEISRVVGGRSKWQSLEAAINQWKLDPAKANSITPEQRKQIRDLIEAVNAKLQKKQQALDQAREDLLNSDDPKEHRKIVTNAHHALTLIDEEPPGGGNTAKSTQGGAFSWDSMPQHQQ